MQVVSKGIWTPQGIGREYIFTGSDFADAFVSTAGKDTFTGNGGSDTFQFIGNTGIDAILDFKTGTGGDKLILDADIFADFDAVSGRMSAVSQGTQIDLGSGNTVILQLVGIADFTADNFSFASAV
jgi:Ca2+-binding RTX toxin-like protein